MRHVPVKTRTTIQREKEEVVPTNGKKPKPEPDPEPVYDGVNLEFLSEEEKEKIEAATKEAAEGEE